MKITVIGGGGVRSLFLAKAIAQKAEKLNISEIAFMDNDEKKLNIYGKMAKKVALTICPSLSFTLTLDAKEAVTDADYVITAIREGGDEMRVEDEKIALKYSVIAQETSGAAGLSFAMRSVYALLEYCELIKQYAKPGCKVFNFTNPAGVVSQTLLDSGYDFAYGICDTPSGMLREFAEFYGVDSDLVKGEVYGLNHLSYFSSVTVNGREVLSELIENDEAYAKTDMRYFDKQLLRERKAIFNEYLYYYYYREKALKNIMSAEKTRGMQILEINTKMTEELSKIDVENDFEKALGIFEHYYGMRENNYMQNETGLSRNKEFRFDMFEKDAGGYAGVALKYIEIMQSGKSDSMVLCTANKGAIKGLLSDDIVEITCDVSKDGVVPHADIMTDEQNLELVRHVKIFERLASKAIREKNIQSAVEALTMHPLVNSYSLAKALVNDYLELNKKYTADWS